MNKFAVFHDILYLFVTFCANRLQCVQLWTSRFKYDLGCFFYRFQHDNIFFVYLIVCFLLILHREGDRLPIRKGSPLLRLLVKTCPACAHTYVCVLPSRVYTFLAGQFYCRCFSAQDHLSVVRNWWISVSVNLDVLFYSIYIVVNLT